MPEEQQALDLDSIIETAFHYFDRYVDRGNDLESILLEELEPVEDGWIVTIGFDGKRYETSEPASAGVAAALSGFGSKTTTTVREVRRIHLDNIGALQKIS